MPGMTRRSSENRSTGALKRWKRMSIFHRPSSTLSASSSSTVEHVCVNVCFVFFMVTQRLVLHFFVRSCVLATTDLAFLQGSKSAPWQEEAALTLTKFRRFYGCDSSSDWSESRRGKGHSNCVRAYRGDRICLGPQSRGQRLSVS